MNNKLKITVIWAIIFCSIVFISCDSNKNGDGIMCENDKSITKEYLMEEFDITEGDIEGIDVEKVLEYWDWNIESIKYYTKKEQIIEALKYSQDKMLESIETQAWLDENSNVYLLYSDKYTEEIPDIDTIKNIAFEEDHEFGRTSYLVSLENSKFYYNPVISVVSDYRNAEITIDLTEEQKQEIISALEKANISEWHSRYNGVDQGGSYYWVLGLEFEDGTIITYHYVKNRDNPQGLRFITGALINLR